MPRHNRWGNADNFYFLLPYVPNGALSFLYGALVNNAVLNTRLSDRSFQQLLHPQNAINHINSFTDRSFIILNIIIIIIIVILFLFYFIEGFVVWGQQGGWCHWLFRRFLLLWCLLWSLALKSLHTHKHSVLVPSAGRRRHVWPLTLEHALIEVAKRRKQDISVACQ